MREGRDVEVANDENEDHLARCFKEVPRLGEVMQAAGDRCDRDGI